MNFELNEEQQMIIDTAGKIAKVFGPEYWLEKETGHAFPHDFIKNKCTRFVFTGFNVHKRQYV